MFIFIPFGGFYPWVIQFLVTHLWGCFFGVYYSIGHALCCFQVSRSLGTWPMWLIACRCGRRPMKCQMWLRGLRQLCLHGIIKIHDVVLVQSRWGCLHVARRVIPDAEQERLPLLNYWLHERGSVHSGKPWTLPWWHVCLLCPHRRRLWWCDVHRGCLNNRLLCWCLDDRLLKRCLNIG